MKTRADEIADFAVDAGWGDAEWHPLAGDASRRSYTRLRQAGRTEFAMLMDAPPDAGEDIRPFLRVGQFLTSVGLAAPEVIHADEAKGFLLLEDLGDSLFDRVCAADPQAEPALYAAATDVLAHLATAQPMDGLDDYRPRMAELAASSVKWYAFGADETNEDAQAQARAEIIGAMAPLIAMTGERTATILRDFHAQNLIWLPSRTGHKRVGLLDFQDAMLGPPAYDLVSLIYDARRDVSPDVARDCLDRFARATGVDREAFGLEAAICSAQRNLRILMIFARMSLHFGKAHYVDFIPRTWRHLMQDLSHPGLVDLRRSVEEIYPEPDAALLKRLKEKCGSIPTL